MTFGRVKTSQSQLGTRKGAINALVVLSMVQGKGAAVVFCPLLFR